MAFQHILFGCILKLEAGRKECIKIIFKEQISLLNHHSLINFKNLQLSFPTACQFLESQVDLHIMSIKVILS